MLTSTNVKPNPLQTCLFSAIGYVIYIAKSPPEIFFRPVTTLLLVSSTREYTFSKSKNLVSVEHWTQTCLWLWRPRDQQHFCIAVTLRSQCL